MAFFTANPGSIISIQIFSSAVPCNTAALPAGTVVSSGLNHIQRDYVMPNGNLSITVQYLFPPAPPSNANYQRTVLINGTPHQSLTLAPIPGSLSLHLSDHFMPPPSAAATVAQEGALVSTGFAGFPGLPAPNPAGDGGAAGAQGSEEE